MRISADRRPGLNRMIVNRGWVVADDELHIGVFCRDDLAYSLRPDRSVHHADTLHLEHQLVLCERRILSLQPVEALGRANFLDINVFEKGLKMAMPLADISSRKSPNGVRPPCIN